MSLFQHFQRGEPFPEYGLLSYMNTVQPDKRRLQDAIRRACDEVVGFYRMFQDVHNNLGYMANNQDWEVIPAELGLTNRFLLIMAISYGKSLLFSMNYSGRSEFTQGHDFHWNYVAEGIRYEVYFQAKVAKYYPNQFVQYADLLYKGNDKPRPQWEDLRNHVISQQRAKGYEKHIVLGIHVVYAPDGVRFIPIGQLHERSRTYSEYTQGGGMMNNAILYSMLDGTSEVLFKRDPVIDELVDAINFGFIEEDQIGTTFEKTAIQRTRDWVRGLEEAKSGGPSCKAYVDQLVQQTYSISEKRRSLSSAISEAKRQSVGSQDSEIRDYMNSVTENLPE